MTIRVDVREEIGHIKDAINAMLKKINTWVDARREIQHIYDLRQNMMLVKDVMDVYVDVRQEDRSVYCVKDAMLQHITEVFDASKCIQRKSDDIKAMLDQINTMVEKRPEIAHICDQIDVMLQKIMTRVGARQEIRHICDPVDAVKIIYHRSSSAFVEEHQELHDIRIVLDAILERYFTNEQQKTLVAKSIWVNDETRILGIQTAVDIMLNMYAHKADKLKERELQGIRDTVNKISNVVVHYNVQGRLELLDIQKAVHAMLTRVVGMINERKVFKVSRIVPCGSKAEDTAVWKYGETNGERYTESDFLAILDCSPEIIQRDHGCRGLCVQVSELPMSTEIVDEGEKDAISELIMASGERALCDRLFWRELHMSLGSACECFTVEFNELNPWYRVSYKSPTSCKSEHQSLCSKCNIEMPTGILRVNSSVTFGQSGETNCSLAFTWTSKTKALYASDKLLQVNSQQINSLSIHVDFLPALEVFKNQSGEAGHDFFLVPKHCNVCDRKDHWRKSNCLTEIAYVCNEMSEKHRKCYKIMKYCLSVIIDKNDIDINGYHVKTVALNHSRECSDSSEGCAECVLKMLHELKHAYKKRTLPSFHESSVDILGPYCQSSYTDACVRFLQQFIERLCSVTIGYSCNTLLQPLSDPFTEHDRVVQETPEAKPEYDTYSLEDIYGNSSSADSSSCESLTSV